MQENTGNDLRGIYERRRWLEDLDHLLDFESKIEGAKEVSGNLFHYFLMVDNTEIEIKTIDVYPLIKKYLDDKDFVRYLIISSDFIATKWLNKVTEERKIEALQTIKRQDILSEIGKFKYIKIGEDGTAAIEMPFSTMQAGMALDNTCKATEEMFKFSGTEGSAVSVEGSVKDEITECMGQLDKQIDLLRRMGRDEEVTGLLERVQTAKIYLERYEGRIDQLIKEISKSKNIVLFPEWLQKIFKHKDNNLKAIICRPKVEDAYMRSIIAMRVCTFNHKKVREGSGGNHDFEEIPSPFYNGSIKSFQSQIDTTGRGWGNVSEENLKSMLSKGGKLHSHLGSIAEVVSPKDNNPEIVARKIAEYMRDDISMELPQNIEDIMKSLGLVYLDGERYLMVKLKEVTERHEGQRLSIDTTSAANLSVACQFFLGNANIILQVHGNIGEGINFGKILEADANNELRTSFYECVTSAINRGLLVENEIVRWMNLNRQQLGMNEEIDGQQEKEIIESFHERFGIVVNSMEQSNKEADEFFILENKEGFWSEDKGQVRINVETALAAMEKRELKVIQDGIEKELVGIAEIIEGAGVDSDHLYLELLKDNPNLGLALWAEESLEGSYDNIQFLKGLKEVLLKNLDIRFNSGDTLLILAAVAGNLEIVKAILAHPEVNINAKKKNGDTALILAVNEGQEEIVNVLLTHSDTKENPLVDIRTTDIYGDTVLMNAVKRGHLEIVKAILTYRKGDSSTINATDMYGDTVLMNAAKRRHLEMVEAILTYCDAKGKSLVDINATDMHGDTVLMNAVKSGHVEIVKALLAHPEVNINDKDNWGRTVLMEAAINGKKEIVEAILAHPAVNADTINATDNWGNTALMQAADFKRTDVVKALLDHKDGDAYAVSNDKAMEAAERVEEGNPELARMIEDHISKRTAEANQAIGPSYERRNILNKFKKNLDESQKKGTDFKPLKSAIGVALGAIAVAATVYYRLGPSL